jgi:hypothetical protein
MMELLAAGIAWGELALISIYAIVKVIRYVREW